MSVFFAGLIAAVRSADNERFRSLYMERATVALREARQAEQRAIWDAEKRRIAKMASLEYAAAKAAEQARMEDERLAEQAARIVRQTFKR